MAAQPKTDGRSSDSSRMAGDTAGFRALKPNPAGSCPPATPAKVFVADDFSCLRVRPSLNVEQPPAVVLRRLENIWRMFAIQRSRRMAPYGAIGEEPAGTARTAGLAVRGAFHLPV